ncbi:MAG TPA: phosphoribosyltransferase family protein [Terriglobales bacterium]|nr:phosphoribosyltransferase family protein [Terriglobales bacterium]
MVFRDRAEAGRALAAKLMGFAGRGDVIVLSLPRGGVVIGYEVAQALAAPLDVFMVRKLGTPGQPELAMGAIASGGVIVLNQDVVHGLNIPDEVIRGVAAREQQEIERREREYRGNHGAYPLRHHAVILVDDGLATGSTMRAAVIAVRDCDPASIVVAVPVAAASTCDELRSESEVDHVVCLATPDHFQAVGQWYREFPQVSDQEVRDLLQRSQAEQRPLRTA